MRKAKDLGSLYFREDDEKSEGDEWLGMEGGWMRAHSNVPN